MGEQERSWSYQDVLRAVGAWLDTRSPWRFTLMETREGFSIVLEPEPPSGQTSQVFLSMGDLVVRAQSLADLRAAGAATPEAVEPSTTRWSLAETGHQDFLRALGFELEDAGARFILLDEIDDGLLLTYSYLDAAAGYGWHKRLVILGREEIATILSVARGRRRPVTSRRGMLDALRRQR